MQRAMAAVQAKARTVPEPRAQAAHVQAALNQGAAQLRPQPGARAVGAGTREPASHVRTALNTTLQAKPQGSSVRPPAPHVQAALARTTPAVQRAALQPAAPRPLHRASLPAVLRSAAPVLQASSQDEVKKIMKEVRSGLLKDGPGNLSSSSKEARKRYDLADELNKELLLGKIGEIVKKARSRMSFKNFSSDQTVIPDWEQYQERFATIVGWDFLLKKTGGGSCDYCAAATFFKLREKFPKAKIGIVSYLPKSNNDYEIKPPEEGKHKTIFVKPEKDILNADSWWPEANEIEIITTDSRDKFPNFEPYFGFFGEKLPFELEEFEKELRTEFEERYKDILKKKRKETLWNHYSSKNSKINTPLLALFYKKNKELGFIEQAEIPEKLYKNLFKSDDDILLDWFTEVKGDIGALWEIKEIKN
ncbi:MAG TPA: hypothetical protein VF789_32885 [Thermoanaerobaculia bacterium]